jgi:DNA-binding XRE family transcriptional regulator
MPALHEDFATALKIILTLALSNDLRRHSAATLLDLYPELKQLFSAFIRDLNWSFGVQKQNGGKRHSSGLPPTTWRGAISGLIRESRMEQDWTQEELGHRSGYDPVYINMLERGRRNPSIRALLDLCQAFGIQLSEFFAEVEKRLSQTSPARRKPF